MLKKLDIYIIKKFLGTFFLSIVLIIGLAIVFDFSEKFDDFYENNAPIKGIIFDYYLNFIPYNVNLFSFLFTFISVIFFTSRMAAHSEIIAIRSSGMSFLRMLVPYLISAFIIAALSFFLSNYIIPKANVDKILFENTYIKKAHPNRESNIHKQIEPGIFIYMESYRNYLNLGYKFSMEKYALRKLVTSSGDSIMALGKLKSKLVSDYIKWDTAKNKWTIHNYYIRDFVAREEKIRKGRQIDTSLRITPDEFSRKLNLAEAMTTPELKAHIEEQKMRGSDIIESFLVEKHKRTAFPFSTFILTIIGVSLSSKRIRGGTGMHIGFGLALSSAYILFKEVSFQFAINGNMLPMLAVWLPNIIFAVVAAGLYYWAPK